MRIKIIFFLLVGTYWLFGCGKVYNLSSEDRKWQIYKGGDLLIFESNQNLPIIVNVTSVELKLMSSPEDWSLFPAKTETLYVNGNYSHETKKSMNGQLYNTSFTEIISIGKGENNKAYLYFKLDKISPNVLKTSTISLTIGEIESLPKKTYKQNEEFTVYKIPVEEQGKNLNEFKNNLEYFYYSKEYGYLKFVYNDGTNYQLKKFIRNGNNIVNVPEINW
ncbi:MAG: hypothetical protein WBF83_01610 [Moheibacter sp.]